MGTVPTLPPAWAVPVLMLVGVRQRHAPIELREQFTFSETELTEALPQLLSEPGVLEAAMLSTCNRTELYTVVRDAEQGMAAIRRFFQTAKGLSLDECRPAVFQLLGEDVALHLFRVASGLDSLILGEAQIAGQVKDALALGQRLKTPGPVLDRLFKTALTASKRVRTETGIADKDVSVSRAAFEYLKQQDPRLLERPIAVVGGGKMAEILLRCLQERMSSARFQQVTLVNRSPARLAELCRKYPLTGQPWEALPTVLAQSDVVFVATGAPHIVLDAEDLALRPVEAPPLTLLDISVPRNVDPVVATHPGVTLYNLDNLGALQDQAAAVSQRLVTQAEAILTEEHEQFCQWLLSLPVVPTLTQLRSKVETIRQEQAQCACPVTGTACSVIDTLSKTLVNKILHDPTVRLKATRNLEEIYQQAAMLSHLFNVDADTP